MIPRLDRHRPPDVQVAARDGKVAERHYQPPRDQRKDVLGAYQRSDAERAGPLDKSDASVERVLLLPPANLRPSRRIAASESEIGQVRPVSVTHRNAIVIATPQDLALLPGSRIRNH